MGVGCGASSGARRAELCALGGGCRCCRGCPCSMRRAGVEPVSGPHRRYAPRESRACNSAISSGRMLACPWMRCRCCAQIDGQCSQCVVRVASASIGQRFLGLGRRLMLFHSSSAPPGPNSVRIDRTVSGVSSWAAESSGNHAAVITPPGVSCHFEYPCLHGRRGIQRRHSCPIASGRRFCWKSIWSVIPRKITDNSHLPAVETMPHCLLMSSPSRPHVRPSSPDTRAAHLGC